MPETYGPVRQLPCPDCGNPVHPDREQLCPNCGYPLMFLRKGGGRVMGGANLVNHAAGWLEGGLTASYEKLIIDAELLQMITAYLEPIVDHEYGCEYG